MVLIDKVVIVRLCVGGLVVALAILALFILHVPVR